MSLLKKTRNDAVKAAVTSYLERRNYPDIDVFNNSTNFSQSAEEMAVSSIVQCESSRGNSILFSCINNDPAQFDVQYTRLVTYIKGIKIEKAKNELLGLLSPLLCHLYLEMLRGGHGGQAQMFLKRHSATLPQKDLSYHQPIDGNLPSALYRPNSLEQLFNSLQNGTIDNETPEKDFMNQILDDIGSVYNLQEIESRPTIAAFRSCKYDVTLSQPALNILKSYLAKNGHVLLMQVLQTWFHIDVNSDANKRSNSDDEEELGDDELNITSFVNSEEKITDTSDIFTKCNGHAEPAAGDTELRELREAISGVRGSLAPLKLYRIAAPDTHLVCARTDPACRVLAAGLADASVRLWQLGDRAPPPRAARNVCRPRLAAAAAADTVDEGEALQLNAGAPLLGHCGAVQALHVLPREQLLLSAGDRTVRAWRMRPEACAQVYRGHNYPIWCMDVSKNGLFVVTGSQDRTAKMWSLDRTYPVRIFVGHMSDVTCVKFHPNEAYVATGGADRSVRLWSASDARLVRVLWGHRAAPRALAFAPNGASLASAGDDKKIKVWDLATCTCIHEYRGHHGKVTALDWAAAGAGGAGGSAGAEEPALLVSAAMDAVVKAWDHVGKAKPSSSQEVLSSTFNTKCSYLVDVQVHPNWIVAIGTKR